MTAKVKFLALVLQEARVAMRNSEDEQAEICHEAHAAFLRDHAAWWMPTFGRLLEKRANDLCE